MMTKLEEKLIELGYEKTTTTYICDDDIPIIKFEKKYCYKATILIILYDNKIEDCFVETIYQRFMKQEQINNLQQAFDEMQRDLEELKLCQ